MDGPLPGKYSSGSSRLKEDNFINVENRGNLWKVSVGIFEIFLVIEKLFRSVSNQKNKF